MSDEDAPSFEPPRAAIPSRAGGTPVPPVPSPLPPVVEAAPRARRKPRPRSAPVKAAPKRSQKLSAHEIKRINTNREKALKMRKRYAKKRIIPKKPAKNPNRPLELKTRMGAVLTAVSSMSKAEAAVFTAVMQQMEDMSRSGRRHVIGALTQVYG